MIAFTGINRRLALILCAVIGGILLLILIVSVIDHKSAVVTEAKPVNTSNINLQVSTIISETNGSKKVVVVEESTNYVKLPPIVVDNSPAPKYQEVKTTAKVTHAQVMANGAVAWNDKDTNDEGNSFTGTDNKIGVGKIDEKLTRQKSLYTIFAGSFLPAQMVTGLNSELKGEIVAIIRRNIYDSTAGKYLLIPQGSRLIGTYDHDVAYGQDRLMVGWNRVIYPNGTSFVLHGQPGTDLEGYSGFSDSVDNHYLKVFGSAFVMGLIFGGTTVAIGNQGTNPYQLSAGATIANQVGAQMSQAGITIVQKGINIPPTIVIHQGYKFNVLLTADLVLKPYVYAGA